MAKIVKKEEPAPTLIGAVLYVDGSARPNPGHIGWGAHGFFYDLESKCDKPVFIKNHLISSRGYAPKAFLDELKAKNSDEDKQTDNIQKYIDENAVTPIEYIDALGTYSELGTNNRAEALGFYKMLQYCDNINKTKESKIKKIRFLVDSEYVRKAITEWCALWEHNKWIKRDGTSVINVDIWKDCYTLYKDMTDIQEIDIEVKWIRGHADILGNIQGDYLSVIAMNYSSDQANKEDFKVSSAKGYWKTDIERHPLINFKRAYFNSSSEFNFAGRYFLADPGVNDLLIGKRIPETGFAVLKLNKPDPIIDCIIKEQVKKSSDFTNSLVMIKLDRAFSGEVYPYLKEYGKYCLLKDKRTLNLNFVDGKPITVEQNPVLLTMRAIDMFNLLEDHLETFEALNEEPSKRTPRQNFKVQAADINNFQIHDCTSEFYDIDLESKKKVKYKLKDSFKDGNQHFFINKQYSCKDVEYSLKIPILIGLDILPINNLKRLCPLNPKISLITWTESVGTLSYALVVQCDEGLGIWSNFYSDKLYL